MRCPPTRPQSSDIHEVLRRSSRAVQAERQAARVRRSAPQFVDSVFQAGQAIRALSFRPPPRRPHLQAQALFLPVFARAGESRMLRVRHGHRQPPLTRGQELAALLRVSRRGAAKFREVGRLAHREKYRALRA